MPHYLDQKPVEGKTYAFYFTVSATIIVLCDSRYHACAVTQLCPTLWSPWTVAFQAPLSMEFPRCREPPWEIPPMTKVMRKRPDSKGGSGLEGPPESARPSTPKPKSVCLTIFCLSPALLTLTGGYPRPPFSERSQLRALINKSPGHERSISIQTPLLAF